MALLLLLFIVSSLVFGQPPTDSRPTVRPTSPPPTGQPAFKPIFPVYPEVKYVHMAYMTHLDIGYTNFTHPICNSYFFEYFPKAVQTARELRDAMRKEKFVYTTHPWLLLEFLDGAVGCGDRPSPVQIKEVEDAILRGDITWHAKPFNLLPEASDPSLFSFGLTLSDKLDQRFNKTKKIAASSKDVPGVSRAVIPLLAKNGVKSLHIGCNAYVVCPAVPEIFLWKDPSGSELLTMVHAGFPFYGGDVIIPGYPHAFVYNFTEDNTAPLNSSEVIQWWAFLEKTFPFAEIYADSLDNFTEIVLSNKTLMNLLPKYSGEMGDTWLYGIQADPWRISTFREISRILADHVAKYGYHDYSDRYSRRLLKIPEHNWGLSVHDYLNFTFDIVVWENFLLDIHYHDADFQLLVAGWNDQRSYLFNSSKFILDIAPNDDGAKELAKKIDHSLYLLKPRHPYKQSSLKLDLLPKELWSQTFETKFFSVGFNSTNGRIENLFEKSASRLWASQNHPMGHFIYQSFSMESFNIFNKYYNWPNCGIPCWDFSKPGLGNFSHAERRDWQPTVTALLFSNSSGDDVILVELQLKDPKVQSYGPPGQVFIKYTFSKQKPTIYIDLQWFNKTRTRLPEAMWLSFNPIITNPGFWSLDVLGEPINPYEVVVNGSRHIHAIWRGVTFNDTLQNFSLEIQSLDCALVSPGDTDHILNFGGEEQPQVENGMHFNLYNNLWGTAFNQWYDEDARYRFALNFAG